ncbi:MAG: hypothetical protein UV74_C0013G0150 [Candidatus Woesebacteria bacterium GW2011_GWB1_43_14]|uniref:N-acetyltransferase domain-containing protein n=1 Tax=Candidatus Woesebacteria bacterium GW2011_GWB1_43_14 TaxID=1618578 RepID=A0A0G1GDS3_9BACT|nr:MAG: hypothetical protein UV51_C0005G0071 [Candidatus Woesebacteria bacterium GW2011_GWC1_42_9]KKS97028.1 MAG: hypothetical protein UV74_C0013G0150 [Candidatus Woesebacteria bacterium GW2011_GWB1_43_14]
MVERSEQKAIYPHESFCVETSKGRLQVDLYPNNKALPLELRKEYGEELIPLVAQGFMWPDINDPGFREDSLNHVVEVPRLLIARDDMGCARAFIASEVKSYKDLIVYHLYGIMVDPLFHGSGLAQKISERELEVTGSDILLFRTQSNKMLGLGRKLANLNEPLGMRLAPLAYPDNLNWLINERIYRDGKCLYGDMDRFEKDAIPWIDWRHGDALVVAGFVNASGNYKGNKLR